MNRRYGDILETIGNTPVVRINNLAPDGVELYAKLEARNPLGSVKDRLALGVIEDAEQRGALKPGQTIVEATSGNTGLGLAMVCAQRGYPLVIVMAENFSVERRKMLRFLGAKVVLTPAALKGSGMLAKADELAKANGWWQPRQFENPANAEIHARTTAREILAAFADCGLDYWVSGFGTGGTVNGVSRVLRQESPGTRIVVCEPDNSAILASGVRQPRNDDGSHRDSHPYFRPHPVQGWSPDFIPKLAEEFIADGRVDDYIAIDGQEALQCSRQLAQQEGILAGISSGATLSGALQVAKRAPKGSRILCMLPDTGERYLSTVLFEDIQADMNADEVALSCSTPTARFDVAATPAPAPVAAEAPQPCAQAVEDVAAIVNDPDQPFVMFALEWCEFCWSVRRLLKASGIPYRAVDLDSVENQRGNRGGRLRAALRARTGWNTLPQIFVGGEFIGGCSDLFDRYKSGELQAKLARAGVVFDDRVSVENPHSFLPAWQHTRDIAKADGKSAA